MCQAQELLNVVSEAHGQLYRPAVTAKVESFSALTALLICLLG